MMTHKRHLGRAASAFRMQPDRPFEPAVAVAVAA